MAPNAVQVVLHGGAKKKSSGPSLGDILWGTAEAGIPGLGIVDGPAKNAKNDLNAAKAAGNVAVSGTEAIGAVATHILDPQFWLRVGEFMVGGILLTVGLSAMMRAGDRARSAARTSERAARVGYSVTPAGSAVNKASRKVATTARRARS